MSPLDIGKRDTKENAPPNGYPTLKLHRENVLVVVKAAPQPSLRYRETVCTAGITKSGKWIRLYPVSFRYIPFSNRYSKYQWIDVEIEKHTEDKRIDSYRPKLDSLKIIGGPLPASNWEERKGVVLPTVSESLEKIREGYDKKMISLGIFKPKRIIKFIIEKDSEQWGPRQQRVLSQGVLFGKQPKDLDKIPYKFSYMFECNNLGCKGHKMQIIDWEIYELYRNMKEEYRYSVDIVLEKVRQKWFDQMCAESRETYLIVGTVYRYPTFVILGVFWPPKV